MNGKCERQGEGGGVMAKRSTGEEERRNGREHDETIAKKTVQGV